MVSHGIRLSLRATCHSLTRLRASMLPFLASTPQGGALLHARGGPHRLSACAILTAKTSYHQPYVLATAAVCLGAPDYFTVIFSSSPSYSWRSLCPLSSCSAL